MTETADAPPTNSDLQASETAAMMASFEEAQAAQAAKPDNDGTQPGATPTKQEPAKAVPVTKAAEPADEEFPAELLGAKTEPEAKPKVDEDEAILNERPQGQIKHDHFQRVQDAAKRKVDAARAELEKFRADLEKLRTASAKTPDDYEPTKKQLAELREELSRVAFERTPEFKERFTDREVRLRGLAEKAATDAGIDPKVIANALAATGKHRFQILEEAGELSPGALSYISNVLAQHDDLTAERATVLSQSKERMAQWQQQQQAKDAHRDAEQKAIEAQAFEEAGKELASEFRLFGEAKEGKFKTTQAEAFEKARKIFHEGNLPEKELARVAYKAAMFDVQDRYIKHVVDKLNAANSKIAELTAAGPHVNGSAHLRNLSDDSHLTEEQRSMRTFEESRAKFGQG